MAEELTADLLTTDRQPLERGRKTYFMHPLEAEALKEGDTVDQAIRAFCEALDKAKPVGAATYPLREQEQELARQAEEYKDRFGNIRRAAREQAKQVYGQKGK